MTVQGGHEQGPSPSVTTEVEDAVSCGRPRRGKAIALVVGFATAVTVASAVALSGGPAWLTSGNASAAAAAARPVAGRPGSAELRRLAARVEELPNDTGSGAYASVKTETWADRERPPGKNGKVPDGQVRYHEHTDEWFADDHSGTTVTNRTVQGRAPEHERRVEPAVASDGGPGLHRFSTLPTSDAGYAAAIREDVDGVLPWFVRGDDGTDEDVTRYLARHEDPSDYLSLMFVAAQFTGPGDEHQPRTPEERAAVLRYLATIRGAVLTDGVEDAVGRPGIAVTVNAPADFLDALDSPEGEGRGSITLLFDRRSGNLLASKISAGTVTTPLKNVRYRKPHDHVTVIHVAKFTDRIG